MIKILAEGAAGDFLFEIAGGRGENAHVHLHAGGTAKAGEGLVHQHPQDLALRLARHVGHFIEIERAAMRLFQSANLAQVAAFVLDAEELLFHAVGGDGCGVDGDERPLGARRQLMHLPRRQFLACARGAGNQNAAVGAGDPLDGLAQLVDGRRFADEAGRIAAALFQVPDLALQHGGFQRALRDQQQPVGLERLLDIVIGAALDGGNGGFHIAVAGNDDDRQILVLGLDLVQQRQPVEAAALKPDVQHHEGRPPLLDGGKRRVTVAGRARAITLVIKDAGDHLTDIGLVIDDQDVIGHGSSLVLWSLIGIRTALFRPAPCCLLRRAVQ